MIIGRGMKKYRIIRLSDHRDMIILLTMDMSREMMVAIENDLRGRMAAKTIVYFDFLMSNGMSNRFYYSSLTSLRNNGVLKICNDMPKKYVEASDRFFVQHYSYVEASVLSQRQKALFREGLLERR